jgi:imidazolonepropionase-like amidohydrolase
MLTENEAENLKKFRAMRREGGDQVEYDALMAFHRAGVTILAGSDAPNGGTTEGASVHLELELLVEAGLTPVEALRAATFSPARAFGLQDRGRIAEGLKADLLLVEGKPDQNITDTRKIAQIWKAGEMR